MSVELFLNELSYRPVAENQIAAQQRMLVLITTLQKATKSGAKRILRTNSPIDNIELADEYRLSDWRYNHNVRRKYREEWRFLLVLATKAPFLADHDKETTATDQAERSEFTFEGQPTKGLGITGITDGIAISFDSDPKWDHAYLPLEYAYLNDDSDIETHHLQVQHGSKPAHIETHHSWIQEQIKNAIRDGKDAWEQRATLFPRLAFCDSVASQLLQLQANDSNWNYVVKHLWELQRYADTWTEGAFNPDHIQLPTSVESTVTLTQYPAERTFSLPDGETRLFSWHSKINWSGWRIYFHPDTAKRIVTVGYIGKHLPTVKYH